ncbi:hypothetical protein PHYSODRAFT_522126 [Phytophthora sojae]|uniref:SWIM-type domain-containing protein n=1 Tax=Phytophthora sojae (strain P6497) TaxID=1094619 RepID=G5A4Y8_PHYSP|nr:hypothetical protein PHYSODRAFT_522126 [Phytophthora sojae]EGZ09737.1 hypothetical protein PHYSODRAFT_522126 [Phytophthora sojae]|eukprot:XP_009534598.1 hypothetical protein PHYSODRAFT_522126 [Phytophthora sojae]
MDQMGMPCRHLIAVLESSGKLSEVFSYFQPCYKVSTYQDTFKERAVFIPIETEVTCDAGWLPARHIKKPGRPRTKCIRSSGEEGGGTSQRCSQCHQRGHNKRSCTEQLDD